jgi:hypothetical protein
MTWDFQVTGDNDGGAQLLFANELQEVGGPGGKELTEALRNAAFHLGFAFSHHHTVTIQTRGYLLKNGVGSVTVSVSVVPRIEFEQKERNEQPSEEGAP